MQRLTLLLFALVPFFLLAQEVPSSYPPPPPPPPPGLDLEAACFTFPEQMPTISYDTSKCEESAYQCSLETVQEFIKRNINYGTYCSFSRMVVIEFIIEKNGQVNHYKVLKPIEDQWNDEALRVIKLMNESLGPWNPGSQSGRPVPVRLRLPVKFDI